MACRPRLGGHCPDATGLWQIPRHVGRRLRFVSKSRLYEGWSRHGAGHIQAVIAYMREQAYVDAKHIVLVGHSAGAWGSLAASSESPQGVVGAVLFAPGRGSLTPDRVCGGGNLVAAAGLFGRTTQVPTLWIYSENDHFFGPTLAREIYDAFRSASHSQADFVEEPSCGNDGHFLSRRCPELWHSGVAAFLKRALSHN